MEELLHGKPETPEKRSRDLAISGADGRLSFILKAASEALRKKDALLFAKRGIRRYWIVGSAEELALRIKQNYTRLKALSPSTLDFINMYSELLHPELKAGVLKAIREALAFEPNLGFSLEEAEEYLAFVVDNAYVCQGGVFDR
ncbi:hypothetical protein DIPPA_29207 [Diplonema papillatum]|nr:hypothetical protein DIPPA_29207 [Diplonema papillatum]